LSASAAEEKKAPTARPMTARGITKNNEERAPAMVEATPAKKIPIK